jgi:hypothetical protein
MPASARWAATANCASCSIASRARSSGLGRPDEQVLTKTAEGTFTAKVLGDYTRATLDDGSNVPRIPPYRMAAALPGPAARSMPG